VKFFSQILAPNLYAKGFSFRGFSTFYLAFGPQRFLASANCLSSFAKALALT
jgi:hypothetical protein